MWTVTGNAKLSLLQGNNVAELVNNQASASMAQTIVLPPHAVTATFDLGVKTAQPGDTLEVLYDGNLLKSIALSSSSSTSPISVPLPANLNSTGTFQIRFGSTTRNTADVTLDNFAIQSTTTAPVLVPQAPVFPIISATDPLPQNQGISLQDWQSGITSTNPADLLGIAITAADSTHGTLQFSTDDGTTWLNLGTPAAATPRLLTAAANTRIRFIPAAGYTGNATFLFVAWDRSSGINGGTLSATKRGGLTPFSLNTITASITITA